MVTKAHLFKPTILASKERKLRTQTPFFRRGEYHAGLRLLVLCSFMHDAISGLFPDVETILSILMQCGIPTGASVISVSKLQVFSIFSLSMSDLSRSSKTWLHPNGSSCRFPREGLSLFR
ncbi:hypothetical protein KSP39_PZI012615 [Platanthera zijinensis]|uniref:Uncharacterized protein n=1 Tax=Platanthera zijinensis TaxID=2320716 RepID=A0AAP0G4I1_9ASPA